MQEGGMGFSLQLCSENHLQSLSLEPTPLAIVFPFPTSLFKELVSS